MCGARSCQAPSCGYCIEVLSELPWICESEPARNSRSASTGTTTRDCFRYPGGAAFFQARGCAPVSPGWDSTPSRTIRPPTPAVRSHPRMLFWVEIVGVVTVKAWRWAESLPIRHVSHATTGRFTMMRRPLRRHAPTATWNIGARSSL